MKRQLYAVVRLVGCAAFLVQGLFAQPLLLRAIPDTIEADQQVTILLDGGGDFSSIVRTNLDGLERDMVRYHGGAYLILTLPSGTSSGTHVVTVTDPLLERGGQVTLFVKTPLPVRESTDGNNPDPKTQNGNPKSPGEIFGRGGSSSSIHNPPGGIFRTPGTPCDAMHRIDGRFTDSVGSGVREWAGITPMKGRFSNLYLDYCDETKTLFLLNDWHWGTWEYDSIACYNRFEFVTGGGAERWEIRVYHNIARGTTVIRNGQLVADSGRIDSTYVLGGRYGFSTSLLEEAPHTIYEFGIKVSSGFFIMPAQTDPYRPPQGQPSVTTVCDEDGYGLVQEPSVFTANLGKDGITVRKHERIIPLSGVKGLVTEPKYVVRTTDSCTSAFHEVDGVFSTAKDGTIEWENSIPAVGSFSLLHADYCDSVLYIMNDWVHGIEEPDEKECYNLFEVYTGGGMEHWAIAVYHDIRRGVRVFRNRIEVTGDTSIVRGGAYGFGESLEETDIPNTLYEFGIQAQPGAWCLMYADPGPATFCDELPDPAPRLIDGDVSVQGRRQTSPDSTLHAQVTAYYNDVVRIAVLTPQDTREWFGRSFKATILYDPEAVYPLVDGNAFPKSVGTHVDTLRFDIPEPGTLLIYGIAQEHLTGSGELFGFDCLLLAGADSITELSGTLDISNRTTVMRRTTIDPIIVAVSSLCPITNAAVRSKLPIRSMQISPQPVRSSSTMVHAHFDMLRAEIITIEVCDLTGRRVARPRTVALTAGAQDVPIELPILAPGTYVIIAATSEQRYHLPVIIVR